MADNKKAQNMVDAVNNAITTIMSKNKDSRVGIATFSTNSSTLLPLGSYTPQEPGKYLEITQFFGYTISTNVNQLRRQNSVYVTGGTYTQKGIKEGAGLLTSANTQYTTTINGEEKTITRTPVLILLSDGDPTFYSSEYIKLDNRTGDGNNTTSKTAYYTIRTADYYKKQITQHYYPDQDKASKLYTIGIGMDGTLSKTILNPNKQNVDACKNSGRGTTARELWDELNRTGTPYAFDYADGSYIGTMSTTELENIFNTIINDNSISTDTRPITLAESDARRVDLVDIDTSKAFSLKIGTRTYSSFAEAQTAGYVKGNSTSGYYVDFSGVERGTVIEISYNK